MAAKPSIVFVTGAWHTSFHIRPCIDPFANAGYTNFTSSPLLAAGQIADTDQTINHIREGVLGELDAGRDVVLILHSAAGLLGSEAANRVLAANNNNEGKGTLRHIVYVGSFLDWPPIVAHLIEDGHMRIEQLESSPETTVMWSMKAREGFFNDVEEEDVVRENVEALTWNCALSPKLSSEAWRGVRRTFVVTERDRVVPVSWQEDCAQKYGCEMVRIDAGHDPFISRPEKFVEVVDGIVKKQ